MTLLMIELGLLYRSFHLRLRQYVWTEFRTDQHRFEVMLTQVKLYIMVPAKLKQLYRLGTFAKHYR